jgi:hypothetical protein
MQLLLPSEPSEPLWPIPFFLRTTGYKTNLLCLLRALRGPSAASVVKSAAAHTSVTTKNYSELINCTNVLNPTPVGPFANHGFASSFHAVPAISK